MIKYFAKNNIRISNCGAEYSDAGVYLDANDNTKLYCVGQSFIKSYLDSQYDTESRDAFLVPYFVQNGIHMVSAAFSRSLVAVLDEHGNVYMFGTGGRHQMGDGNGENTKNGEVVCVPLFKEEKIRIVEIMLGAFHVCAKSANGDYYVWGCDDDCQLSGLCDCGKCPKVGVSVVRPHRVQFPDYIDRDQVVQLYMGGYMSCVVVDQST